MATKMIDELALLDATAQADLVRKKQVKPIELVDAAIDRIEQLNPTLNAVITPLYDQARETAKAPLPDGPFAGVPLLLKDLDTQLGGARMAMGSAFLREYVPDHDSEIVRRLKAAGLIVLGKTNTPEFGLLPTTEPQAFGATRNPWDTSRTPGGSSGGSAAAVASGMVPVASGGDGGGSIRIPASCCGIFGLKPTRARNPLGPDMGDMVSGLIANHVLTRSVRDCAALLDVTSGPELGDPYWAPPPARPFIEEVGADPGRLRIAFSTQPVTGTPVHPDCVAAVHDAAVLCADLGHEVEEAAPQIIGPIIVHAFTVAWTAGAAMAVDGYALLTGRAPAPEQFETLTWALAQQGRNNNAPSYLIAVMILQQLGRTVEQFLTKYDFWLTPTLAEPPLALGSFETPPEDPLRGFERAKRFAPFTPIQNATGQPAMSVPLYWNDAGLPIGVHFAARFGDEARLFRLAGQLEQVRPWAHRRPPVSA